MIFLSINTGSSNEGIDIKRLLGGLENALIFYKVDERKVEVKDRLLFSTQNYFCDLKSSKASSLNEHPASTFEAYLDQFLD